MGENVSVTPPGTIEAKFYGLGSDGTVGANKNSIKIIGDTTDMYSQAYFAYDSKKSGGITVSHLRFGNKPIRSTYLINNADFIACHVPSYIHKYDMLRGIKKGGTFLLNTMMSKEDVLKELPDKMKLDLAKNEINFYIINATEIAEKLGLGTRTNTIMQAAFFKLANVIPYDTAVTEMKNAIKKSYGKKGDDVVKMNNAAVDSGAEGLVKVEIPAEWKNLAAGKAVKTDVPEFISKIMEPINRQEGDLLPVSAFIDMPDGTFPAGTAAYEKRGIAVNVPEWIPENCIQCTQCAYVCPPAVIRPFLLDEKEVASAPKGIKLVDAKGKGFEGLKFKIQISPLDCTGCGNCAQVCPAKDKALVMKHLETQLSETENWNYMADKVTYKDNILPKNTVKGSQFAQPLFEFSGACAGCGETPYIKLITQLVGDRMMVANATGCSSIYGGSAPATPYCRNKAGQGPAWANSLFEDNAEYGYGMNLGVEQMKTRINDLSLQYESEGSSSELKALLKEWRENRNNAEKTKELKDKLIPLLEKDSAKSAKEILKLKQYIVKKSIWIFGGDGWAYDIGFGGLDHVIASGEDVNILVMDTEVYSNTGGQSSKATPTAAVAKFAASGKKIRKKDLGMIAMSYGYVYVAQVSMGANHVQYLKAVMEAEAYPGPSLIIAYSPCINHGLRAGMGKSQLEAKLAVECGYWSLYRYNPLLEAEGKNPFTLDSKEADFGKFQDFLAGEVRYTSLKKEFPGKADELFKAAEENAKWRLNRYKRLASAGE
jgi:pyruvate-ferredoxin/flavodoxin oxidoreductase